MTRTVTTEGRETTAFVNPYSAGLLSKRTPLFVMLVALAVSAIMFWLFQQAEGSDFNIIGTVLVAAVLYAVVIYFYSLLVEEIGRAHV